jgi:hypothetical protein
VNPVPKLEEKEAKKTQNTQICQIHAKDMISNEMFKYGMPALLNQIMNLSNVMLKNVNFPHKNQNPKIPPPKNNQQNLFNIKSRKFV